MKKGLQVVLLCFLFMNAKPQGNDSIIAKRKYTTKPVSGTITLDGIPTEAAWDAVPWEGNFVQHEPSEGKPPSQQSAFKILYDNRFLYIAYRCFDTSPDSIVKRMSRRDEFPGDWMEINIDSYHDLRTAFSFTLSVSGVRGDEAVSNDGNNWDASWNPIWYSKTHIDSLGWTAEVKIPFSQLRYGNEKEKVWGIQVHRRLFRKEERSVWQPIPHSTGVWVSRFGELNGLNNIPRHRQIEIAPYLTFQADTYKKQAGNPFATGFDKKLSAGLDGKYAVTNDLILDFTINPDFGQVEADPSQVRIDGFQNFFEEKRPFFIESRNIFDYQLTGSITGGDFDADMLFYSRRIGGSPHGYPNVADGEYVKYPQNTAILGAAKFSGKTKKGWSIGLLECLTERSNAVIDKAGVRRKELVEPLTNYSIIRLQKDVNSGNTVLGGIITAVNRDNGLNDQLHRAAYSGGLDFLHQWKHRTWYIRGNAVFSHVTGTKEAILNTQQSFEHLFQRTNASEFTLDANRTSLTGSGATVRFGKSAGRQMKHGEVFRFETGVTYRSPQLELNDMGFMLASDEINHFTWAGLNYQRPFSVFNGLSVNYNHWSKWDFSGRFIYQEFNVNGNARLKSNWQAGGSFNYNPYDISNNALRGTTSIRRPAGLGFSAFLNTDSRKKLYASFNYSHGLAFEHTVKGDNAGVTLTLQPIDALRISLGASYATYFRRKDQFVENVSYNNTIRTIVSRVDQKTLRFTARANFNITPDITIQYYGQPFITRPIYSNFGYVSAPMAKKYDARFHTFTPGEISYSNGTYSIDENNDGIADYTFAKPDFNFVQFRSNLIFRWEYKRGSEFYFVWSQSNTADAFGELDTPVFSSLFNNAFAGQARNIFLVKMTYRFLR
jgi:hypothetical protein